MTTLKLLELVGFITGIAGVWLTLRRNIWCFPVGLLNVCISLWLFFRQQLYADALQQLMYIVLLSYGWQQWKVLNIKTSYKSVSWLSEKELKILLLVLITLTVCLGSLLRLFTDAQFPWTDSFATSTAFIAQYLVAKRKIENWILWMAVNLIYIAIYVYKDLHLYSLLFCIYLFLAFYGYAEWKKELKKDQAQTEE